MSDVETAFAHTSDLSYSDYSEPPSEADVSLADLIANEVSLSLTLETCNSSVSAYSMPPSETEVEMFHSVASRFGEETSTYQLLDSPTVSEYSLPPSETDVEFEEMLYPQAIIMPLNLPEREGVDTAYPGGF
uniref:NAC domain-containing protein n=1 Tax=Panagrellus redivivus TaxID=6233 RepID=A0A7E4UVV4_PANRE